MSDLSEAQIQQKIREKLNREKIQLWLPPYTQDDADVGFYPRELLKDFASELGLSERLVESLLEELRQHALNKLAGNKQYQESGIATVRVKLAGPQVSAEQRKLNFIQVDLNTDGQSFKKMLSDKFNLNVKLIARGRIVQDDVTLRDQQIKHNTQIMALVLTETEAESLKQQAAACNAAKVHRAAEVLADSSHDDTDDPYLQISDQSGTPLQLPAEERRALTVAMTLHQKGRKALKQKLYAKALCLLIDADSEFSKCTASILTAVDNYAVLSLDICWCYLCLKDINELPDTERRLQASEVCLKRSYGENMERLITIKGDDTKELVLFVRLHLLQGILAFHKNDKDNAARLINKAASEVQLLTVDDNKLSQLMALGFSTAEARLGLRRCGGNVEMAVSHVIHRREEKKEQQEKEKKERKAKRLRKSLGKTANGEWVIVENYETLLNMGYPAPAAKEALRHANNNIEQAIQIIQDQPDLMFLKDTSPSKGSKKLFSFTEEQHNQILSMGFEIDTAIKWLRHWHGNIDRCLQSLLENQPLVDPDTSSSASSTSSSSDSPKSQERKEKEKEAVDLIADAFEEEEEDYLDSTLEEERFYINEYKALLKCK